jgi:murein DD-endopeptidase MepM/ murein hydrolase activator NlpD
MVGSELAFLVLVCAVTLAVLALPLVLRVVPERPAARVTVRRSDLVLAVAGAVAGAFFHTTGQTYLWLTALVLLLAPVLVVVRLVQLRRRGVETGLLRHPLRPDLRPYLAQALNHLLLWSLVAATVWVGTYDLFRAAVGSGGLQVFVIAFVAGAAVLVGLALVPARRPSLPLNVLVALGSVFVATQLALTVLPASGAVVISSPLRGKWYVAHGGHAELVNYHRIAFGQRDAMDILVVRGDRTHRAGGTALTDYFAFGRPLHAPGSGTVTAAVDTLPDLPVGTVDRSHPEGNHVVVDIGDGRFVLMGHLRQGSLRVGVGDRVRTGQVLAEVGNSGNTDEPHLHLQVQNMPDFDAADPESGLTTWPILFRDTTAADVRRGDYLIG